MKKCKMISSCNTQSSRECNNRQTDTDQSDKAYTPQSMTMTQEEEMFKVGFSIKEFLFIAAIL